MWSSNTADDSCHCPSQEFSKEVEGKSSLKSSVITEGNQLLRLKKVDTVVLRTDLARIDSQWTELLTRIPVVQEKLHQVSSHAAWLNRLSCSGANRITPLSAASLVYTSFHTGLPSNWEFPECIISWSDGCYVCSDPNGEVGLPSRHFWAV